MIKKLKEIKPGEIFKFGSYEWIKLEEEGLALTKEITALREFDTISNDFNRSKIKLHLSANFLNGLLCEDKKITDFELFPLDLSADDGTKEYETFEIQMGLLTADLYRKNRHLLEPINNDWWLATPKSCLSDYTDCVLFVDSDGIIWDEYAEDQRGVRPLCKLSDDTLVEVSEEDKPTENTEITELIKKWVTDRDLTSGNPTAQMVKLMEKVGELTNGINKDREGQIIDSIGDIYVGLVVLCMQLGLDVNDCIKAAYEEIKDRKGKLVNGLFVKEEDLR